MYRTQSFKTENGKSMALRSLVIKHCESEGSWGSGVGASVLFYLK